MNEPIVVVYLRAGELLWLTGIFLLEMAGSSVEDMFVCLGR